MQYIKDLWFAEPVDSPNLHNSLNCKFCNSKNHNSKDHKCNICNAVGIHSAKDHCKKCNSLEHKTDVHCPIYSNCNILIPHVHNCKFCAQDHRSEDHVTKCYCTICKVKGHLDSNYHYDCHKCNFTLIGTKHITCLTCGKCTYPYLEHVDICEICGECCININYNYTDDINGEPIMMCSSCYRVNGADRILKNNVIIIKK